MLTREETIRVYALHYGCEVKTDDGISIIHAIQHLGVFTHSDIRKSRFYSFEDAPLLLTPLSAITDEHAVELGKIYYGNQAVSEKDMITDVKMFLRVSNFPLNYDHFWWKAYQYLISKGYDVPLFFGIDHPDNGKTAIECGIAIIKQ